MTDEERNEVLTAIRSLVTGLAKTNEGLAETNRQLAAVVVSNTGLSDQYDVMLTKASKHSRNFNILVGSVAFNVLLLAVVLILISNVRDIAVEAKAATSAVVVAQNNVKVTCEAVNEANAGTLNLFEDLAKSGPAPKTAKEAAQKEVSLTKIRKTYAQRAC